MQSLECMTSFVRRTSGDIPPPLVGPTTTFALGRVFVFGGRTVAGRGVSAGMWVLDLETLVWERIEGEGVWPRARYFHSVDYWRGRLVMFGGMGVKMGQGMAGLDETATASVTATTTASCVLDDLWVYDINNQTWEECTPDLPTYTSAPPSPVNEGPVVPVGRYAHLSAVVGDRLIITGGQEISNEYVFQQVVFNLGTRRWESALGLAAGEMRGSYRSVAVTAEWEEVLPAGGTGDEEGLGARRLTYSRPRRGGQPNGERVVTPRGDVYVFSNSNFTDVHRELHTLELGTDGVRTTDLTPFLAPSTTIQPPGLRFPFAAQVGRYLVVGGTYLSQSAQQFALWSLDLVTWRWAKVDAEVLEGNGERAGDSEGGWAGGSWNRAVWCGEGRLMVFGNRYRSLQEDYEHRAINLDHVAIIELEVFGIYRPPERHPLLLPGSLADDRPRMEAALRALHEGRLQDCQVVCEDGRAIGCSSRVLQARWDWFRTRREREPTANALYISESYPIVKAFLEYIYTLDLVTVLQHRIPVLSGLLMLAKQYGVPHLEALAVHALHSRLDEGTALGIYEVATLCECRALQVRALKMVLAIQKRAGKGSGHRRQQSGAVPASQESGLAPPASEGDSARTIQNGSAPNGTRDGHGYQANQRATGSVDENDRQFTMAFSSPPSAFSTPKRRKPSTRRRNYPMARDSPVVPNTGPNDEETQSSEEETKYEPATYRTRRRSASIATVHHFDGVDIVDEQGLFVGRRKRTDHGSPVPPGERRRTVQLARKIASMGSLFHKGPGPRIRTKTQRCEAGSDGRATSPESSQPSSPATPTDLPMFEEPGTGALSPSASFPFVVDVKLASKMDAFSLHKGHSRTRSLGLYGIQ